MGQNVIFKYFSLVVNNCNPVLLNDIYSTDRVLLLSIDLDYSVWLRTFMQIAQIRQEGLCRRKSSGNAGDLSFFAGERVKALKCGWHPRNAGELESLVKPKIMLPVFCIIDFCNFVIL